MDEYTSQQTEELKSELYYDLKEKYIKLKLEHETILVKLIRAEDKLGKMCARLYPLRVGRKYFNFALKICRNEILKFTINTNQNLDSIIDLLKAIDVERKAPVTIYNEEEFALLDDKVKLSEDIE